MGRKWREAFKNKHGREPNEKEVADRKRQKQKQETGRSFETAASASRQLSETRDATLELQLASEARVDGKLQLELVTGDPQAQQQMLVSIVSGALTSTLQNIREKAARRFGGAPASPMPRARVMTFACCLGAGAHYRLYLGKSVDRLCQLNDEDDWQEQCKLQKLAATRDESWPKVFAVEVPSEERASTHARAPPPAKPPAAATTSTPSGPTTASRVGEDELRLFATPAELRQAVNDVIGRKARRPQNSSGGSSGGSKRNRGATKPAGRKSKAAAAAEDPSASETEEQPTVLSPVEHMQALLQKLVDSSKQSQFLDAHGQPRYRFMIKTDDGTAEGNWSQGKVQGAQFAPFEPAQLTAEHLCETEALKPGLIFFGCTDCVNPIDAMKGKFAVGPDATRGAFNKTDGRPQLKSFSALIGGHETRKHPMRAGAKLSNTATNFTRAAAAMQAQAGHFGLGLQPAPSHPTPSTAGGGLTPPESGGDVVALRMPFKQAPLNSREYTLESVLTVDKLQAMATTGATVCDAAFDILLRNEFRVMEQRAEAEGLSGIGLMVRYVSVYDVLQLDKESCRSLSLNERTKEGGVYDTLRSNLGFESLTDIRLVCFGVTKCMHDCVALWLPERDECFHFDSNLPSGLGKAVMEVVKPFAEHCARRVSRKAKPLTIITKGEDSGIEQQPVGSNVCAFASALFTGEAIASLFSVLTEAKDKPVDVSATLSQKLHALNVAATKYARKRSSAKRDVAALRTEYLAFVASKEEAAEEEVMEEEDEDEAAGSNQDGGWPSEFDDWGDWEEAVPAGSGQADELEDGKQEAVESDDEDENIAALGPGAPVGIQLRPGCSPTSDAWSSSSEESHGREPRELHGREPSDLEDSASEEDPDLSHKDTAPPSNPYQAPPPGK